MEQHRDGNRRWADLMQSAQDGDAVAYRLLLREIVPLVRRVVVAGRRSLPREDVEDVVQEALLSLHKARATYDPRRPFLPWLLSIVRNRMADGTRLRSRQLANEIPADGFDVTFLDAGTNSHGGPYADLEALMRAIGTLPSRQRLAIELMKLREMTLREASAASGMSIGALKSSSHRATRALRVVLRREDGDGH
jgi:RNA polymerase sigma-70 factor (ECF subfamily)